MNMTIVARTLLILGVLLSNLILVERGAAQTVPSFLPSPDHPVGTRPIWTAVGDWNGDGHLDLATGNVVLTASLSVLLGRGDGTFEAIPDVAMEGAGSIAVGDFNHDGHLDLAMTNSTVNPPANTVFILLGRGDGTFQRAPNVDVGQDPEAITVGDFNGDGHQDLAVANASFTGEPTPGSVSILLGRGDGTFQAAPDVGVGPNPLSITVGDFNRDGHQDFATANDNTYAQLPGSVSILLGRGDGTFQAAREVESESHPFSVTVGDFNGDGRPDLAILAFPGTASIRIGRGDGTFEAVPDVGVEGAGSIAVGDLNQDGHLDLAITTSSPTVSIQIGRGDGTFQAASEVGLAGLSGVTVGDFNSDGRQDLLMTNTGASTVSVLINNTPGERSVKIDIKPGSERNRINPRSHGVVTVAILTTPGFDATAVDPRSARFGPQAAKPVKGLDRLRDVDRDGRLDVVLTFKVQDTGITCGQDSAALTGETVGGQSFAGEDAILTVGCHPPHRKGHTERPRQDDRVRYGH